MIFIPLSFNIELLDFDINSKIVTVLDNLTTSMGLAEINYNLDFKWNDIFKIYGVEFVEEYSGILEKLVSYIKVLSTFTDIKLMFFVNLRSYLCQEELEELYEICDYCKINLVLIEPSERLDRTVEIRYIIDKDQCMIDAN